MNTKLIEKDSQDSKLNFRHQIYIKILRNKRDMDFKNRVSCKLNFTGTLNSNSHNLQNIKTFLVILKPKINGISCRI